MQEKIFLLEENDLAMILSKMDHYLNESGFTSLKFALSQKQDQFDHGIVNNLLRLKKVPLIFNLTLMGKDSGSVDIYKYSSATRLIFRHAMINGFLGHLPKLGEGLVYLSLS
jgi:hypothetical protein